MSIDRAGDIHIWTARPQDIEPSQWPQLTAWLDAPARLCAAKFRRDDDRQAYVLAHAVRRLAVATALALPPQCLAFSSEASGKPILTNPPDQAIYFSHAHTRALVACAVTRFGPVGIDAEPLEQGNADMALLHRLVVLPDAEQGKKTLRGDDAWQFFFYWTLLEAYWKCRGSGLSFDNPALHCQPTPQGWFEVSTSPAGTAGPAGRVGLAWATAPKGPPDCMIMLAVTPCPASAAHSGLRLTYHTPVFEPILAAQDDSARKPSPSHRPWAPYALHTPANPPWSMRSATCVSA